MGWMDASIHPILPAPQIRIRVNECSYEVGMERRKAASRLLAGSFELIHSGKTLPEYFTLTPRNAFRDAFRPAPHRGRGVCVRVCYWISPFSIPTPEYSRSFIYPLRSTLFHT
jgi:hypothetical protein